MSKNTNNNPSSKVPDDRYIVVVNFEKLSAAGEFLRKYGYDLVETLQPENPDAATLIFYLTKTQIKTVVKAGLDHEVKENVSKIGRESQKEVGKGDRFKGGKIAPKSRNLMSRGDY